MPQALMRVMEVEAERADAGTRSPQMAALPGMLIDRDAVQER